MTETSTTQPGSAAERPPLTLEQWAAVFAHACHYPPEQLGDALARLDVAPAEWEEANRRWPGELTKALGKGDRSIGDAFNAAFLPVKHKLKEERPETSALVPLRPPAPRPAPRSEVTPPQELTPAAELAPAVLTQPAVITPPMVIAPPIIVRSFDQEGSAGASQPLPPTRAELAALVPTEMRNFKDLGSTVGATDVAPGPALPFHAPRPGEPPLAAQHDPRTTAVPEGTKGKKSLSSTVTAQPVPPGLSLPFAPATGARPASIPPPPVAAPPRAADLPSLSVEQYASLCVELELAPTHTAETLIRYNVAVDLQAALDAHWRERMAQPEVWHAFGSAHARFKAWMLQQQKR